MKKYLRYLPLFVCLTLIVMSCQDRIEETYMILEPEYLSYNDLRDAFQVKSAEEIIQPGKLYFKDNFIFVNEYMKGIHIIENSDPSNPEVVKFLELPGNVDLAISGNILFADSYVDLVAIDISDLDNMQEVKRIENMFPYYLPEPGEGPTDAVDETLGVVTGWKAVEKTVEVESHFNDYPYYYYYSEAIMYDAAPRANTGSVDGSGFGIGGSMARFTLYDDYLYAIDQASLKLFDISEPSDITYHSETSIGWDIETLFPYNNKLFIGAQTGMYIYSLADPADPEYISMFAHVRSCDPVVVEGDYAYVTLRAGNLCGEDNSLLDVIDISNIYNPFLVKSYPMAEPYGLGIDDSVLFVCDGNAGLKIYNAGNPRTIADNLIKHYPDINAFDVIPLGEVLLMIGTDGLYQYDYADLSDISQLSFIPIYE